MGRDNVERICRAAFPLSASPVQAGSWVPSMVLVRPDLAREVSSSVRFRDWLGTI